MKYLITTLLLFSIIGCDQIAELSQPSPETVLNEYLTAFSAADYTTAYNKLSSADQSYKSLDEYKSAFADSSTMADMFKGKVTYEVQSVVTTGNSALATVKQTVPDMGAMFTDFMGAAFAGTFSGDTDNKDVMEKILKDKYKDGNMPMTTTTEEYNLVKEKSGWRLYVNFEAKEKIISLLINAKELRENKKYVKAVEAYSNVLSEDAGNAEAKNALKETEAEIDAEKIKQDYITNVKLYDFEATRIDTYLDKKLPAVRFAVKNEGDRTLNKVEVTVYFKDIEGNVIFEENYFPVLVSKYSYRNNKPLKPNYVKRQEKGKYYTIKELGDEWETGSAEAVVTDIEFATE